MRTKAISALALAGALLSAIPALAGEFDKTGQAGMTFLKIGPVARAAGMADAYTSLSSGAASTFYNPAGLGFLRGKFDAVVGQVQWIADIKIISGAIGVPVRLGAGDPLLVAAVSFVTMDYGDIYGTVINNDARLGYDELGKLEPSELALGLTLSKQFTDKFSLGVTAKYVSQTLPWYNTGGAVYLGLSPTPNKEDASVSTIAFDAGTFYRTGFGSSVISMSIRNFARTQTYVRDGFRLPMTFHIGVSTGVFDLLPDLQRSGFKLLVAVDGLHPPDHPEKLAVGGELSFRNIVSVRSGYSFNHDARKLSLGGGIKYTIAGIMGGFDYAYSDFGSALGAVNYFTLSFGLQ